MQRALRVSRRRFLKSVGAAAAAPYVLTSSALGDAKKAAASDRLTVGHIGIGSMGGGHLGAMVGDPRTQVLAVCDVRKDVRDKSLAKAGGPKKCKAYNHFEDVLAHDDIDAVVIATPDHWHATIAVAAAKAGKDIYCEKPLSLTIREARAMVDAARRYGRVFQTGSQQRSGGRERLGCELVRNGRIGKVKEVYVNVGGPSSEKYFDPEPVPEGFDWNRWLGPAPWKPYHRTRCSGSYGGGWRVIRDYSGGMMTDWGAHHFDIAQWALGMDDSGPVEILPPDGKDVKMLTYVYANGVRMYRGRGPKGRAIQIFGTDGVVMIDRGGLSTDPPEIMRQPIGPNDLHLYRSRGHRRDWLDCVRTRQRPVADVAIGASSVTICHLGNIAHWLGRPLKWNPDRQVFLDDDEANRWLDRPKRAPWRLT